MLCSPSQPFACASICHCFISWQLPFLSHPPIHQVTLLRVSSKTSPHTSHLLLLCLLLLIWTSSLIHCATSRVVAQKRPANRLKDPGVPSVRGLDLICINLHNFIKAQGDAVHTVAWDTSERNSPLRMAVITGLSLLTTVGDWNSEKFHAAWPNPSCSGGDWRFRSDDLRNALIWNVHRTISVAVKVRCEVLQ